jgi:hypothetical protein
LQAMNHGYFQVFSRVKGKGCDQGSLFGWIHLFCFRLANTEIGELDFRFLGKLRGC